MLTSGRGQDLKSVASEMAALPMVSYSQLICHEILNVNLFYLHASVEIIY